jgi:uncharacterized protein
MNLKVTVRVYEELNSYLPPNRQKRDFVLTLLPNARLKELIEDLGIPLSLVDLILVNGQSVDIEHPLNDGDRVSIYPVFETFNISSVSLLHEKPLRMLYFICDIHLGKLAKYMKMLGFDVLYNNHFSQNELIRLSVQEKRILLTRNRGIFKNKLMTRGYLVKSDDVLIQLKEIISYFDLKASVKPLSRCLRCNMMVHPVPKNSIQSQVPVDVFNMHENFTRCDTCDQIYWMGSHYSAMMDWISRI